MNRRRAYRRTGAAIAATAVVAVYAAVVELLHGENERASDIDRARDALRSTNQTLVSEMYP